MHPFLCFFFLLSFLSYWVFWVSFVFPLILVPILGATALATVIQMSCCALLDCCSVPPTGASVCSRPLLVFHFLGHRSNLVRRLVLASAWRAGTCGQRGGRTRPDYIRETPKNTGQSEQPNDLSPLATTPPECGAVRA